MTLMILVASNGLELTLLRELCSLAALITCLLAVDTLGSCETASQFCVPKPETPAEAKTCSSKQRFVNLWRFQYLNCEQGQDSKACFRIINEQITKNWTFVVLVIEVSLAKLITVIRCL